MFRDRKEGGRLLAERLKAYEREKEILVLALPRGGVVTGAEIARHLRVPLDVLIVRKIGAPLQPELAAGAVSETGAVVLNQNVLSSYGIPEEYIQTEIARQKKEISGRQELYREGKGLKDLEGKTVIIVDDGVATGATMKAAIETLKKERLKRVVLALPVAPPDTADELRRMVDEFICLETPSHFMAVGNYYDDFSQTTDEEVVGLLGKSEAEGGEQEDAPYK